MTDNPVILWFRQDLRLADNPALLEAVKTGAPLIPLYIHDDESAGSWRQGSASRFWLHHSLTGLDQSLSSHLACYRGNATEIINNLVQQTGAKAIFWNRCYEPWRVRQDVDLQSSLESSGIEVKTFNASLLYEPWSVKKSDGTPYRVFTPFFRKGCAALGEPAAPLSEPRNIIFAPPLADRIPIAALGLLPKKPRWDRKIGAYWTIDEAGAQQRLEDFLQSGIKGYSQDRNRPDLDNVSRLSPYLHFGEISPRFVWHAIRQRMIAEGLENDGDVYLSELGWREFSYSLLTFNPDFPEEPLQKRFEKFPWRTDPENLQRWQKGLTGFPIVDAGMRQLWETGWMHNRVRMIVGSFLVKDLLLHWSEGEKWFWDCLVDADLANNAASWQWIAGCGADAAPYFRIFNPVSQGEKFDPAGDYVRRFVPELAKLPGQLIHRPWDAPPLILKESGVSLGKDYPFPIVDHKKARDRALLAFQATK